MRGVVVLALLGMGCGSAGDLDGIPEPVRGVWVTDEGRYQGRGFQLDKDVVMFAIGRGKVTVHRLQAIDTTRTDDTTLFELRYRLGTGHVYAFDFYYHDGPDPVIRFKHQPEIEWRKTDRPLY